MFDYLVVADDYTGAVEIAAKFMNGGYRSAVTLDPGSLGTMRDYPVVALDTETFSLPPERAARRIGDAARNFLPWKDSTTFFKRIEPALRGNVGAEVRTLAQELGFDYIVAASIFSYNRKSVEEGTIHLDRQEPMSPLTVTTVKSASSAATAKLLRDAGLDPVEVLREDIRAGRTSDILGQPGCYCFDAENDEDLRMIVRGVLKVHSSKEVLWVGSVGLANALATAPRPFVFVVGTAHPRSVRQARQLIDQGYAEVIPVVIPSAGAGPDGQRAKDIRTRAVDQAESLLRCGQSILLAATSEDGRFIRGEYPNGDAAGFLDLMADTARAIMGRAKIGGLCVTGGNCAVRIVQRAKAENIVLEREIQEGITLLHLAGGPFDGLPVISKSGSLGGERALMHCMEYFQNLGEEAGSMPWL